MSLPKNSYKYTLQLIADILSYENSTEVLCNKIKSNEINWEQFVYISSNYLVLTTCYCKLKQKKLIQFLPEDLSEYLESITAINRNRNKTILEEINQIARILNTNNVNYVFLKGSAMLIKGSYKDLGERMLGDIDILVEESQIHYCYQLLIDYKYTGTSQGLTARHFDYKHLPRLQSDTKLAAVEVHKKVLSKSYKGTLDANQILEQKKCIENVNIPSNKHLLIHTIMNFQANDSGYRYSRISFKSIYDFIVLRKKYDFDLGNTFNLRYFKHYFSIGKIFFQDFNNFKSVNYIDNIFLLKLKHPYLRKLIDGTLENFQSMKIIITSRIWSFFTNKNYRNELLKEKMNNLRFNEEKS